MAEKRTERSLLDELHGWAEREEQRAHSLGKEQGAQAEYWRGQERAFRLVCEKVRAITLAEDRRRDPVREAWSGPPCVDSSPLPANPSKDVIEDELRKCIADIWRCWQRCDGLEHAVDVRTNDIAFLEERIGDLEQGAKTTDAAIARLEDGEAVVKAAVNSLEVAVGRLEELMVGVIEALDHHSMFGPGEWLLESDFLNLQHIVENREAEMREAAGENTVSVRITEEPRLHSASGGEGNE